MDYQLDASGIFKPSIHTGHRNEEYDEGNFDALLAMQSKHFWYRGRHRFLLHSAKKYVQGGNVAAIDLGGGVGGWVKYLSDNASAQFAELALADSSLVALSRAKNVLPSSTARYQVDLTNLGWKDRWDMAFLLDVIEHLPNDLGAMKQATQSLKPGGKLFVTAPALQYFWSYNDDFAKHLRRYSKNDFKSLAERSRLILRDVRYFMFLLSPLYWIARRRNAATMSEEEMRAVVAKANGIPPAPINEALAAVFGAETPLGHVLPFPWGTSILGVFEKPIS